MRLLFDAYRLPVAGGVVFVVGTGFLEYQSNGGLVVNVR
jgi:hypothetical protein